MTQPEDTRRKSGRDLLLVLLILPIGILCMFMTGQIAIKLAPQWVMQADMRSLLDPNATFVAQGVQPFIEPLDPAILTRPAWGDLFLTPNAYIPTHKAVTATPTPPPARTPLPPPVLFTPVNTQVPTSTASGPIVIPTGGVTLRADLKIEKSDNTDTYTPGTPINYTIVVTNLGPDSAPFFNVTDNVPAAISGLGVSCTPVDRCGTNTSSGNNISYRGASLYAGGAITISVSGTVSPGKTGNLANTANVSIPSGAGTRDPNSANNTSTDSDTQLSVYDLAITKSDGTATTYTAIDPINYTIVVTNNGPSNATDIRVVDNKPTQITSWTWTCTSVVNASGCNGVTNSTSSFINTVNIQSGGRIEYSVRANPAGVPQNLSNTATIVFPTDPTLTDPDLTNNTATDTDIPYIDVQITKTDGVTTYNAGNILTYTVTVTNASTFSLAGVTISDLKPPQVATWQWCVGAACTGFISTVYTETIPNLAAGASQVYTVTANTSATATEDLTNTATVRAPAGFTDAVPGNNSAEDTDTLILVDLQITKDDGVSTYRPGDILNYLITVTNTSAIALNGVTVDDNIPALIDPTTWTWTCTPDPGASCTPGPGNTNIHDTAVNLPAGASVTYSITATVLGTATGDLTNEATVYPPTGIPEDTSNNTAVDRDAYDIADPRPPEIGTTPDNIYYSLPAGQDLILSITTVVNGHPGPDLVYYEYVNAGEVYLDLIEVQVGDGTTWFTVFNWGNESADLNSNMNFNKPLLPPLYSALPPPEEYDQRHIQPADLTLFPPSGIAIDLDGYADPGIYPYVRFIAPAGDSDGHLEIDAIITLP